MTVNTKHVNGRRKLNFGSYDDMLADVERLTTQPARTLGNWSQSQIYKHLAMSLDAAIDGTGFSLPAPTRWLMSLLMKKKFLTAAIPSGYKAPASFVPSDQIPLLESLADLRRAVERQKSESRRAIHPAFGRMSRDEWDQFNLRHAEMHLSFLVPATDGAG